MGDYLYEEYLDHINFELTNDVEKYVDDVVLEKSRYLFITKKGKQHYAYCTHCNKETKVNFDIKHNIEAECPSCGSECTVKYAGYSRKKLIDQDYFLRFDKSTCDKNVITARGYFVYRDYSGDYKNIETHYSLVAVYIFRPGEKSIMLSRYYWHRKYNTYEGWEMRKSVHDFSVQTYGSSGLTCKCFTDQKSLDESIKDTVFQYMDFGRYNFETLIKGIGLYSHYPLVIEHLSKIKFYGLIDAKIYGLNTYSAVSWKGKDLYKALKINKQDLNALRDSNLRITPLLLKLYQINKKDGSKLKPKELSAIAGTIEYPVEFIKLLKYGSLKKVYNYICKQRDTKRLQGYYNIISTYRDYIEDCNKLNMDLKDSHVLFPMNLVKAHEETIKRVKYKENKDLNQRFEKRYNEAYKKYYLEFENIFIRPARSAIELIREGEKLHHCVGGYAERHAKGETTILFIRDKSKPRTPFFTVEIKKNEIVQVRGKYNCRPEGEIAAFIEKFEKEKLEEKNKKARLTA
ncbi:MAG: PcfJ domain-containing protein [Clostridium sp.]|uniref:PcfJ domain-containing protein n=1 Tax=Clostridium sp. TaxID=1506 RepID=UPI00304F9A06